MVCRCRLSLLGTMALFDSFSPHTTHNGHGATGSPVKEKPIDRYLSLYSPPFLLSFEHHLLWAHRLDWLWGDFDQEWVLFFSNIHPCLRCVTRVYINHLICNLLFAYLSINCAAYRHQQAYGTARPRTLGCQVIKIFNRD